MSVLRNDLQEQRGIYQIDGKDGLWRVYAYQDQPVITMCNLESGVLLEMDACGPLNRNTTFLRFIDDHDVIMDAEIPAQKVVDVNKPVDTELSMISVDDCTAMLNDFVLLVGDLLKAGKLTKELKDSFAAVHDVARPVLDSLNLDN